MPPFPSARQPPTTQRCYATDDAIAGSDADLLSTDLDALVDKGHSSSHPGANEDETLSLSEFEPLLSRNTLKAHRPSKAGAVLDAIKNESRHLYWLQPLGKVDFSHLNPAKPKLGGRRRPRSKRLLKKVAWQLRGGPLSLTSILARQLQTLTGAQDAKCDLTVHELSFLHYNGHSEEDIQQWVACLLESSSDTAAEIFQQHRQNTPLFLVLLFLRRKRIRTSALCTIMRHLSSRFQAGAIEWLSLRVLVIRLVRHARVSWPESLPWIASFFCAHASHICNRQGRNTLQSPNFLSSLTLFCNVFLSLLSLTVAQRPFLAVRSQESAQFRVLQFMASCDPAVAVTRTGFRATTSVQLIHAKTKQEIEWAHLKGPAWPPWKEDRNAMDEDKGYDFGASRASLIMHRMQEAGYSIGDWEELAEMYAGWDTDQSPTIQTRTTLGQPSVRRDPVTSQSLLWAARIRTTRTKREAWACFLAYESSNVPPTSSVYMAMFDKLHYPEVEERDREDQGTSAGEDTLLPGDVKEVWPDPSSPLNLVYLSEAVPTFDQFYRRMQKNRVQPDGRLFAFLIDTLPEFPACLDLLEQYQDQFRGGVRHLLHGACLEGDRVLPVPEYFFAAFIRFLLRFGMCSSQHLDMQKGASPDSHDEKFWSDAAYRFDYARELLLYYSPTYRPAWTAYMRALVFKTGGTKARKSLLVDRYTVMCALFEKMDAVDLEPDEDQIQLLYFAAASAARGAYHRRSWERMQDDLHRMSTASYLLRTVFHNLVQANIDANFGGPNSSQDSIILHLPNPVVYHAYVRALGFLSDWEGLYSFSRWMTAHHHELNERANAQFGGPAMMHRTILALRCALEGTLDGVKKQERAPQEIIELVKAEIECVEGWGWPPDSYTEYYSQRLALWGRRRRMTESWNTPQC